MSKQVFKYDPVMFDRFHTRQVPLEEGTLVRKTQPHGAPRNGTMGMCYVEGLDGIFYGLVMLNSLAKATA